jgi:hypothetical protein
VGVVVGRVPKPTAHPIYCTPTIRLYAHIRCAQVADAARKANQPPLANGLVTGRHMWRGGDTGHTKPRRPRRSKGTPIGADHPATRLIIFYQSAIVICENSSYRG